MLLLTLAALRPMTPTNRIPHPVMIDISDLASLAADVPPAAQATAALAATAAIAATALPQRRISFSTLDEDRAIAYLRSFPTQAFQMWSNTEWNRLGASKLDFSVRPTESGVRLIYYLSDEEARKRGLAGLVEDGSFDLEVRGNAIVGRSSPGKTRRGKEEEVVWQRLVLQITKGIALERAGGRPDLGKVSGFYPCSMESEIAYMAQRRASDSLWKRY